MFLDMPGWCGGFAEALGADELWGWPVEVLDHLLELRQQAWRGEISIEEWRERDARRRAGMPTVDTNEVQDFQVELVVEDPLDSPREQRSRLVGRLTVLAHPAPTDDELWDEWESLHDHLTDSKRGRNDQEIFRKNRERVAAWLTRPGSGVDKVTGLPWPQIARYRTIDVPGIGKVPQFGDSARQLAVNNPTVTEQQRANWLVDIPARQQVKTSRANLKQEHLTWLPRLLLEAVTDDEGLRPLLTDLTRIWSDPNVQRFLIADTSHGWPSPFDH
jgi:hypothetical protein